MSNVIHNRWPCCGRPTRWRDAEERQPGQVFRKKCVKDGREWEINVVESTVLKSAIVFVWTEVNSREERLRKQKEAELMSQEPRTYHITGINPEPWTAPESAIGRKGGKMFTQHYQSAGLKAYQEAVKEEIVQQNGHVHMFEGPLVVEFFFWRNTDNGEVDSRKMVRNEADATNMQKACEDALQGILYGNDKSNRIVSSYVVDVGREVQPHIAIRIEPFDPANWDVPEIPKSATSGAVPPRAWDWNEDGEPF